MTRHVLFIQGGGADAHDAWDNKLVASLARELGPDYEIHYPRMPDEADPNYTRWKAVIARELAALGAKSKEGAILVGHSIGATILIAALAEEPPSHRLAGIFLIAAPFIGKGGWSIDGFAPPANIGKRLPPGVPIALYHGTADDTAPVAHADLYARVLPQAVIHRLEGRDHQLDDDLSEIARDIRSLP